MSLRNRIPDRLRIGESIIAVKMEDEVQVFPTSDYVLLEISHKVGRISILTIARTALDLVKNDNRMVAIRGYGFKGIGLAVRIAHEIKRMETRFLYQMTFDTFDATEMNSDKPMTSVQIIVIPPD
jgi:hypothetical protein